MKYLFSTDSTNLIITLDTENGRYNPQITSVNDPNITLENDKIWVYENGKYLRNFLFFHIGTISGATPTSVSDAFSKLNVVIDGLKLLASPSFKGSAAPTDIPTGTEDAVWITTQAGTYTNFGGVIVNENSRAEISRAGGVFSISQAVFSASVTVEAGVDTPVIENINLYKPETDVTYAYIDGTGQSSSSTYPVMHSDYLAINDSIINVDLVLSERLSAVITAPNIYLYDSNKVLLSYIAASEFGNLFKIVDYNCRFIRFNTAWTDGVQSPNLKFYKLSMELPANYVSNLGFEKAIMSNLTNNDFALKSALITDLTEVSYVDVISYQPIVEMCFINTANNVVERIKINLGKVGYSRIPSELIKTTFSSFYLGFYNGIFYSQESAQYSLYPAGGVLVDSDINFSYSVGFLSSQSSTDFKIAALKTYDSPINGNYTLSGTLTIPPGKKVRGDKCTVTITDPNAKIILNEGSSLDGITFVGNKTSVVNYTNPVVSKADLPNYKILSDYDNSLIYLNLGLGSNVQNCIFKNINRSVILVNGSTNVISDQGFVSNNCFYNCITAISTISEFVKITGNQIHNCVWAGIIYAGNVYLNNNIITMGCVGLVYDNLSGNGAHGSIVGGAINHMAIAGLYFKDISVSQVVSALCFMDADLIADYCEGLVMTGCLLDNVIEIVNGKTNSINGCMFRSGYQTGGVRFIDTTSSLVLKNNLIQAATNHSAVNN